LDEGKRIVGDLIHKLNSLCLRRMINTTLQNAAAMAVGCNLDTIRSNSIVDELQTISEKVTRARSTTNLVVLGCQLVQTLLDDVVAVQILDQGYNMEAECQNN
jgi:hypothetical protein